MLQIIRETGRLTIAYYKFEIEENKGQNQVATTKIMGRTWLFLL